MTSQRGQGSKRTNRRRQAETEWEPPATELPPNLRTEPPPPPPGAAGRVFSTFIPGRGDVGHVVVPLAPLNEKAYLSSHVEIVMDHTQAVAMQRVRNGLQEHNASLASGKVVVSNADAIKYILEQLPSSVKGEE